MSKIVKTALVAGVMCCVASVAQAQHRSNYGSATYSRPPETVTVLPPNLRMDRNGFNAPSKIALRQEVPYSDLDLRTAIGANELRLRVRAAATEVCNTLIAAYPVPPVPGTNCYESAVHSGLLRAQAAIDAARYGARY